MSKNQQFNHRGKQPTGDRIKNACCKYGTVSSTTKTPPTAQDPACTDLEFSDLPVQGKQKLDKDFSLAFLGIQLLLMVGVGTVALFFNSALAEAVPFAAFCLSVFLYVKRDRVTEQRLKSLEEKYHHQLIAKAEGMALASQSPVNEMMEVAQLFVNEVSRDKCSHCLQSQSISGKLVVLKFGKGDFNTGFPVILQIGDDGALPSTEKQGYLPPAPTLYHNYRYWQFTYHTLAGKTRIKVSPQQIVNVSRTEDCKQAAETLTNDFNSWLNSEQFRPLKEILLQKLSPHEEIRIIIQTENLGLQQLPWQLWDLFDHYDKAEIGLSGVEYDRSDKAERGSFRTQVRLLAILGNSVGIDVQKDREALAQLPHVDSTFLPEPKRLELDRHLWDEAGWDILFFGGHSYRDGDRSYLTINSTDNLTIGDLKYALKAARDRGLKIAIFNSCDGLNLASELAELQIPLIIVMREAIPDVVAEAFLKKFTTAFSSGKSLYASVREAREKLHGFEDRYPCASWLPVIFQHPAEIPPTWKDLQRLSARE